MTTELKNKIQKAYESLPFEPGTDFKKALQGLADAFNITYDELIANIEL